LLELDDSLARAELGEAVANRRRFEVEHEHAETEAERFKKLEQEQVASGIEAKREQNQAASLDAARKGAVANVSARAQRVERHRIVAPFDGVISRRHVDPGAWLAPGEPALHLVTDERVEVLVRVPESVLDQLDSITSASLVDGKRRTAAAITNSVKALDRSTRTGLLRIAPVDSPPWLRAGASVEVVFELKREGGLVVPRDALVYGVAHTSIVRVKAGKAEPIHVEVLEKAGDAVMVKSDKLKGGDVVVVRGNERLRPGQPLTVGSALAPAGAASAGSAAQDSR
jgi:RND family efflux transporter MFP subunit